MSIIEKAVERLEQLQRANAGQAAPEAETPVEATPAPVRSASAFAAEPPKPVAEAPVAPAPVVAPKPAAQPGNPANSIEIDLDRLHSIGAVTPNAPRSLIGDEFRIIKRPLLRNVQGKGAAAIRDRSGPLGTRSAAGSEVALEHFAGRAERKLGRDEDLCGNLVGRELRC